MWRFLPFNSTCVMRILSKYTRACSILLLVFFCGIVHSGLLAGRTWTSADGKHQIEATVLDADATQVRLRRSDGEVITIPLASLSQRDRGHLASDSSAAEAEKSVDALNPETTRRNRSAAGENFEIAATPGWATFGHVLPAGVAFDGIVLNGLDTQCNIKKRWPDGSIRFAVVTARIPRAGVFRIGDGKPRSGGFTPKVPTAEVRLSIGGDSYSASLPQQVSDDRWLDGSQLVEWRQVVAPENSGGESHPVLRLVFDVRSYADGGARVDVIVENVLNKREGKRLQYDVEIIVNKERVFAMRDIEHDWMSRWRLAFPVDWNPSGVRVDLGAFRQAKAVPTYLDVVANKQDVASGPDYQILGPGALARGMPGAGGRPELGPYPNWTARYLVHQEAAQKQFVLLHGNLSGSWPIHLREYEGGEYLGLGKGRLVSLDERPYFWFDRGKRGGNGRSPAGDTKTKPFMWPDTAHQPSLAFVPYLLTGDRYLGEEMAFWANYCLTSTWPTSKGYNRGAFSGDKRDALLWQHQVRGQAWSLRNIADAAAYLPENDPVQAYLAEKLMRNLKHYDKIVDEADLKNPFELASKVWPSYYRMGGAYKDYACHSPWEFAFLAWAIDRANDHGFNAGTRQRDAIARLRMGLITSGEWDPQMAGAYIIPVGVKTPGSKEVEWFKSYKRSFEAFRDTQFGRGKEATEFEGRHGVDLRLMTIIALENGWPRADEAYRFVTSKVPSSLRNTQCGWAIAPTLAADKPVE